jgi:hypothetical protein
MQKPLLVTILVPMLALSGLARAETAEYGPPQVSLEGLELVEKDRRGELYADPGADWTVYTKIRLDPATVAFRKNWQRDQNRQQSFKVRSEDMERIKSELAKLFDEVFSEELSSDGGYVIVTESGDDVLRVTPHIVDLDVYAPDTRNTTGITRSYTETSGRMTLKLELYDSVTGDLIAAASDRQEAPRRGYMQWTTSVTNRNDARQMLARWARDMRARLDQARAGGGLAEK